MDAYDMVKAGNSVRWQDMNEEERYGIWSLHMEHGGAHMTYNQFCTLLDHMTADK